MDKRPEEAWEALSGDVVIPRDQHEGSSRCRFPALATFMNLGHNLPKSSGIGGRRRRGGESPEVIKRQRGLPRATLEPCQDAGLPAITNGSMQRALGCSESLRRT